MADGLTTQTAALATVPTASTIATDDAGAAGHVQIVKLALSADGSATPITADANGIEVQGAGAAGTPAGGVVSVQGVASGTAVVVDGSGVTQPVSASSLPLPTGAATAAKQPALGTAGVSSTDVLSVQGIASGTALPVSAASLPLPTGASTLAEQQTQSTALAAIQTSVQTLDNAIAGTEMQVDVVTSALPTGAATLAEQQSQTTSLQALDDLVLAEDAIHATGDKGVQALSVRKDGASGLAGADGDYQPIITDQNGRLWVSLEGTNPQVIGMVAEDIALSGNPVRIGVRASAALPTAMSADNDIVTPYADLRGRLVTTAKAGTCSAANVSGSATSVTLLAANTSRLGATIYNDSAALLYVKFGATASTSSFHVQLGPGAYLEVPFGYTGIIDGIWASATGAARVGELT